MEKLAPFATHICTHSLEKVGILKKDEEVITIWREIRGFCKWRYYVEEKGELRRFEAFKDGKWRPTLLEKWIEKKEEEEYVLYLAMRRISHTKLEHKVGGQTLKEWYEGFLTYLETETGRLMLWAWFDSLKHVFDFIDEEAPPCDEWEAYWRLLKWERERLKDKFRWALMDIWGYSNEVIRCAAEDLGRLAEWKKGKFPVKAAIEYVGSPEGIVEKVLGRVDGQREWKEWVAEKVFNNLVVVVDEGLTG